MTEKYTKVKLRRLMDDFPSIATQIKMRLDKTNDIGLDSLGSNYLQLG